MKDRSYKFDKEEVDKIKTLATRMDKRIDEQLERHFTMCVEKMDELTNRLVEGALKAFAANIDERFQAIEERLARDAKDDGLLLAPFWGHLFDTFNKPCGLGGSKNHIKNKLGKLVKKGGPGRAGNFL